jgi:hypothetical protein
MTGNLKEGEDGPQSDDRKALLRRSRDYMLRVGAEEADWLSISVLEMALLMSWEVSPAPFPCFA